MSDKTNNKKLKKIIFTLIVKDKEIKVYVKSFVQWFVLTLLILLVSVGIYSNFFSFEYRYFKCENELPLELRGSSYLLPGDEGYGIHASSDYSYCQFDIPNGTQRDPSTKAGAKIVALREAQDSKNKDFSPKGLGYTLYVPRTYAMTPIGETHNPSNENPEITYTIITNGGLEFSARVMKKDSASNYVNLCSKPAEENWSGTIIGKDSKKRDICKTNLSKYIKDYYAGINIGNTVIMLKSKLDKTSEQVLNTEVKSIFSSMEPYSKSNIGSNYTKLLSTPNVSRITPNIYKKTEQNTSSSIVNKIVE